MSAPLTVVILISGRGSNLQAIIDAVTHDDLPIKILAVISNRPAAAGLAAASRAGITTAIVDHSHFPDRQAFDQALQDCIDGFKPQLVILAGFMRLLTAAFVDHYRGRMLNVHPSLLPDLAGLNTHQRALDAGHTVHGASIHFVTADMDGGPVLLQVRVAVQADDNAERLAARVLQQEHHLYPLALRWFAEGRVTLDNSDTILLDNKRLESPKLLATDDCTQTQ